MTRKEPKMLSTGLADGRDLQVELEVLDVREPDFLQLAGATATVLEVHLPESLGGDLLELLVGDASPLGVEETGGVLRGQRDGQTTWGIHDRLPSEEWYFETTTVHAAGEEMRILAAEFHTFLTSAVE